jgi:hypothetical protein
MALLNTTPGLVSRYSGVRHEESRLNLRHFRRWPETPIKEAATARSGTLRRSLKQSAQHLIRTLGQ